MRPVLLGLLSGACLVLAGCVHAARRQTAWRVAFTAVFHAGPPPGFFQGVSPDPSLLHRRAIWITVSTTGVDEQAGNPMPRTLVAAWAPSLLSRFIAPDQVRTDAYRQHPEVERLAPGRGWLWTAGIIGAGGGGTSTYILLSTSPAETPLVDLLARDCLLTVAWQAGGSHWLEQTYRVGGSPAGAIRRIPSPYGR